MHWLRQLIANLPDQRLRIFASTLLMMGVVDGLCAVVALLFGQSDLAYMMMALAFGFVAVFLPLTIAGFWNFSRIVVPYFATGILFVGASYLGPSINIEPSLFIGAVYPFIAFSSKELKRMFATIPVPIVFYLALENTHYRALDEFFGGNSHLQGVDPVIERLMTLGSFSIVAATMFIFVLQAGKYQAKLQEANNKLDILVRTICHDISNPLMVSLYHAKVTASRAACEDRKHFEAILRANMQVETIIRNVIEMQKVKSGKFDLKLETVSLDKVFDDCLFALQDRMKQKDIKIENNFTSQLQVRANESILAHSVFNNILTNAIKFSVSGSKIVVETTLGNDNQVHIVIRDQGVGIPVVILKDLFNPNKPTTRKGTDNEGGTGFGMPLVKAYVEAMGGDIKVSSKTQADFPNDHGTLFEIILKAA